MSPHDEIRVAYVMLGIEPWTEITPEVEAECEARGKRFDAWLATVTPNPDDAAQRQVIADTLNSKGWTCEMHEPSEDCKQCEQLYDRTARAVLAALAEAGER